MTLSGTVKPVAQLLETHDEAWSASLQSLHYDVYHLPAYAALDARLSGGQARGFLYREDDCKFFLPLVVQDIPNSDFADARSPYGYSGPVSNVPIEDIHYFQRAIRALLEVLDAQQVIALFARAHPLIPTCYPALSAVGTLVEHGQTVSVDLRQSSAEIWQGTRRSHRRAIEQARRKGMQVVVDDWGLLDRFVQTYHENMVRVGATARYLFDAQYFDELREAIGDNLHLASATVEGEYVGGQLFFSIKGLTNAHLSCTSVGDAARGASKLIDDEVRRWAQARGCLEYHLGGGLGGERDALFQYKVGFSERTLPFMTWRVVTNASAYQSLVDRHVGESSARQDDGYFPAYRAFEGV